MDAPLRRPTFSVPVALEREAVIERIRGALVARDELQGRWRGRGIWAELYVPEAERRLWSPYLSIRVDPGSQGSTIFGRYGPHPEVWTFFMFLYFAVVFIVVLGGTFAYVQWASGEPAWGLWSIWLGLPLIAGIHVASAIGRRLGRPQMEELSGILADVLRELGMFPPTAGADSDAAVPG